MEKYENLGLVGEGSYGVVMKCRHKETRDLVAIKKFLESEDDRTVRKIALREIKLLKLLRHDNLVKLLEVFRRKKRLYLVFEFIDRTVLDDLERHPRGLEETYAKKILFQVVRAVEFCHQKDIIHRDVKPENILVTKSGIVKVCDFGFARVTANPGDNLTDYVATRWYRAPELIVGDCNYSKPVDVWAIGCLYSEMLNGDPLFPGDSDIDQLNHIIKCLGTLPQRYEDIFRHNPIFRGVKIPDVKSYDPFDRRYPRLSKYSRDFIKQTLKLDANDRPTCSELMEHDLFQRENFAQRFLADLRLKLQREAEINRSPNYQRKAPSRDASPSKAKPALKGATAAASQPPPPPPPQPQPVHPPPPSQSPPVPSQQSHPRKEEATILPPPVAPTMPEPERQHTTLRTPQPAEGPPTLTPNSPVPPPEADSSGILQPLNCGPQEALETTRSSNDEEVENKPRQRSGEGSRPPANQQPFDGFLGHQQPPSKAKQARAMETSLPMPPIGPNYLNSNTEEQRTSPIHLSTMTPAFPSSPTPQNISTGPPPLKVSDHKVKKLSLYKKAPAFPNHGNQQQLQPPPQPQPQAPPTSQPQLTGPTHAPHSLMEPPSAFKPGGFYAFNLSTASNNHRTVERSPGQLYGGTFTLPALKGSEMPLNKPPGHTPSGKLKKDFWSSGFFRR